MQEFLKQNSLYIGKDKKTFDAFQLTRLLIQIKNDIYKFELYKKYQSFFDADSLLLLIDSIDDFLIKRCFLEQCGTLLSLTQIAYIVMKIERKNERNYLLQLYADKLGDGIFDIVADQIILKSSEKCESYYIQFIFLIFGYRVAHLSNVQIKEINYNSDLISEMLSGTFFDGVIELLPLQQKKNDFFDYADLINTIFHEIEHAIQQKRIDEKVTVDNLNYTYLKIIKETYVNADNPLYDIGNINRVLKSFEVDAILKSVIKTFNFISHYSKYYADLYIHDASSFIALNRKVRNLGVRLSQDINADLTNGFLEALSDIDIEDKDLLNNMFDQLPYNFRYENKHPLLSLETNRFGEKLNAEEIKVRISKCDYILSGTKFKDCNLELIRKLKYFYINMLRDRDKSITLQKF